MKQVETEEIYKGYKIYVVKIKNPFPMYLQLDLTTNTNYFNGYIIIPKSSKFYRKHYFSINEEIKVHGGFTFSGFVKEEYTIGFDTGHSFDNETTQNVDFVLEQLKQAVDQIIEKERIKND